MSAAPQTRVLHLVEDMRTGGIERVIAALACGADKTKFNTEVWCLSRGGEVADSLAAQGITVKVLGMPARFALSFAPRLSGLLKAHKAAVVHCHGYTACTVGRAAAVLAHTPVIIAHQHSVYTEYSLRLRLTERFLGCFSDRIICCSEAVRDFVVRQEKLPRALTTVVYNGTEPASTTPGPQARRTLGLAENEFVVGAVASFVENKGHAYLIKALRTVPNAKLVFIGSGPLREELERLANAEGVGGRVIFAGLYANVFDVLDAFDVLALPSVYREGLSLALVEGLSLGKPLLVSDLQGMREVVFNGENGLLVPPADTPALAAALEKLSKDDALRARMGQKSLELYRQRFTLRQMLDGVEKIYDECLAKH